MDIEKHLNYIEHLAYKNMDFIQECETFLDYGYYSVIKNLYNDFRAGGLTKEECINAKKIYREQYIKEYTDNHTQRKVYKEHQQNILKSDILRCEINKSNDFRKMLLKSLECISLMTGDEVFYKMNSKKLA